MSTESAPRQPLTRSAAARIAETSRRIDWASTYRRVCAVASPLTTADHAEPIGPRVSSERAFAAFVAGCTCTLTSHLHTAECDARWTAAAEAAEVEMAAAPVFEVGQRVRFTDDIGSPELVHVTGVIAVAGPRESVVTLDTKVPGYSPELRSFNRYIELLSDTAELTAVEAVRLVTRRSQAIAADKAARADRAAAERAEDELWVSDSGAASAARLVLARRYRAELRAYGVPVEQLEYAEPAGPEAIDYAHELDENGDWFTCPTHHGAVTQDCACSTADFPGAWGMPTVSYTEQWAAKGEPEADAFVAAQLTADPIIDTLERLGKLDADRPALERGSWVSDETAAALDAAQAEAEALTKAQRDAAEYAAALRTLADIVEATPEVHRYHDFYAWYGSSRGDLAAVTRAALAHGATVAKDIDDQSYNVDLKIGPLKVSALASRRNVCERVVLGTETVTKTVTDPEYVAPEVPTVEVTETVERIEWRCTPLMSIYTAEGGD
jgi:hypothetical protein